MDSTLRWFTSLLLLTMATGCVLESSSPSEDEAVDHEPGAMPVHNAARAGTPFSSRVRDQLAARGIKVHSRDSKPESTTHEPTTVEKWITADSPLTEVADTSPTTTPEKFATYLRIIWPLAVMKNNVAEVDPLQPGRGGHCSATLVASDAVLTAAHCVIRYNEVGNDATTGAAVKAKMRAYNIISSPRRNGPDGTAGAAPHGAHSAKASFWRFSDWPGTDPEHIEIDHDFAIVRLKSQPVPFIEIAAFRGIQPSIGMRVQGAHYPYPLAPERSFHMFSSSGTITEAVSLNEYATDMSVEPGSSGAGVFESVTGGAVDGVIGVVTQEEPRAKSERRPGLTKRGSPNKVILFTPDLVAEIVGWITST